MSIVVLAITSCAVRQAERPIFVELDGTVVYVYENKKGQSLKIFLNPLSLNGLKLEA